MTKRYKSRVNVLIYSNWLNTFIIDKQESESRRKPVCFIRRLNLPGSANLYYVNAWEFRLKRYPVYHPPMRHFARLPMTVSFPGWSLQKFAQVSGWISRKMAGRLPAVVIDNGTGYDQALHYVNSHKNFPKSWEKSTPPTSPSILHGLQRSPPNLPFQLLLQIYLQLIFLLKLF